MYFNRKQRSLNEGDRLMEAGDFAGAINAYTDVLTRNPRHAEGYLKRGIAYGRLRDHANALADLTQAITLDSQNFEGYFNRSLAYMHLRQWEQALEDAEQAVQLAPLSGMAYLQRGTARHGLDQFALAVEDFTYCIQLGERHVVAYINRGECYFLMENYPKALQNFESARSIDPDFKHVLPDLAITQYQLGEIEKAQVLWKEVLQKYPALRDPVTLAADLGWRPVQVETAQQIPVQ